MLHVSCYKIFLLSLDGGQGVSHGFDGGSVGVLGAGVLEDGGAGDEHIGASLQINERDCEDK